MEEQLREMGFSQQTVTEEIESIRSNCQKLAAALYSIEPQVIYTEDSKKRVNTWNYNCGENAVEWIVYSFGQFYMRFGRKLSEHAIIHSGWLYTLYNYSI